MNITPAAAILLFNETETPLTSEAVLFVTLIGIIPLILFIWFVTNRK